MWDDLLTTAQVADAFQVSQSAVSRWVRLGKLAAIRTPGGTLRFRREDVEAFFPPDDEPVEAVG